MNILRTHNSLTTGCRRWLSAVRLFMLWAIANNAIARSAETYKSVTSVPSSITNSIMDDIFSLSETEQTTQWTYDGTYEWECEVTLTRRNLFCLGLPNRKYWYRGGRQLASWEKGVISHFSPNVFTREMKEHHDSVKGYDIRHPSLHSLEHVTPYGPYLLGDRLLSPFWKKNSHYYRYTTDSLTRDSAYITFHRRIKSMPLVDGHAVYDRRQHCITRFTFTGMYDNLSFTEHVVMDRGPLFKLLPLYVTADLSYWYYGNVLKGQMRYRQDITELSRMPLHDENTPGRWRRILDRYLTERDSVAQVQERMRRQRDSLALAARPDVGDTVVADTLATSKSKRRRHRLPYQYLEYLFHSHDILRTNETSIRLRPLEVGYHGRRGVTLREDIDLRRQLSHNRELTMKTTIGYFFRIGEFTGRMRGDLLMSPAHMSKLHVEAGEYDIVAPNPNGSDINGDGKEDNLYFRNFYVKGYIQQELFNGFDLAVGAVAYHRQPRGETREHRAEYQLKGRYRDFAPRIQIVWTPSQQYYYRNNMKVRTQSMWPTFSLNYERGIKGFCGSTNAYEKTEFMVEKASRLSPLTRLMWKVGGGMFSHRSGNEFVEYEYFNNGITAYDWDDDRSGVFQLVDSKYYYNSRHYLRSHIVVESPILLLSHLGTRQVRSERLYVNALACERLTPYFELGYGLCNCLADISFFTAIHHGLNFAVKFNLHLFE